MIPASAELQLYATPLSDPAQAASAVLSCHGFLAVFVAGLLLGDKRPAEDRRRTRRLSDPNARGRRPRRFRQGRRTASRARASSHVERTRQHTLAAWLSLVLGVSRIDGFRY
jgi:hypothetical protein